MYCVQLRQVHLAIQMTSPLSQVVLCTRAYASLIETGTSILMGLVTSAYSTVVVLTEFFFLDLLILMIQRH